MQVLGEGEEKPLVPFHIPGGAWSCEGTGNIPDTARLVGITSMSHLNHSGKMVPFGWFHPNSRNFFPECRSRRTPSIIHLRMQDVSMH